VAAVVSPPSLAVLLRRTNEIKLQLVERRGKRINPPPFPSLRATPLSNDHATKIRRRDAVGMLISFLCLVHCLVAPLLIAAVPALGLGFLAVDGIHVAFAIAVLLAAVVALIPGYRQHHKLSVLGLGGAGVLAVALATTLPAGVPETAVTV
jgi:hypothetical protein